MSKHRIRSHPKETRRRPRKTLKQRKQDEVWFLQWVALHYEGYQRRQTERSEQQLNTAKELGFI